MSVVIDQVVGRVEPPEAGRGPASGGQGGEAAPSPESPGKAVKAQLCKIERRRLRLEAD